MRAKEVIRTFVGACAVYLVMAACGTARSISEPRGFDAATGFDALTNPVDDAKAGPTPPDVAVEACAGTPGSASHSYPGRTVAELARVSVLLHYRAGTPSAPYYDYQQTLALIKDATVKVGCTADHDSATFILPTQ